MDYLILNMNSYDDGFPFSIEDTVLIIHGEK